MRPTSDRSSPCANQSTLETPLCDTVVLPQARCTAAQALDSKWIREGTVAATASNIDIGIARRMKQYSEYNKVKHGLLMRLVEQCNPNELMGLQRQFSLMDKNADGSLSLEEVTQALRQFKTGDSGQRVYTDKQIAQVHNWPC